MMGLAFSICALLELVPVALVLLILCLIEFRRLGRLVPAQDHELED